MTRSARINKRHIIVLVLCLLAVSGAFAFLVSQSAVGVTPTGEAPALSLLAKGEQSGVITERKNLRIKSADELAAVWAMVYQADAPPTPSVDFNASEVLAVFAGTKPTSGYDIEVTGVVPSAGKDVVVVTLKEPGESCITSQVVTSPFALVTIPKTAADLSHEDKVVKTSCP